MESAENKSERLLQLEQLLLNHPQGLHRAEIARRLNVHRATAGRYIEELSLRIPIWEDGNLLGINRDDYLTHVRLTIHESMAVHLATRLMATRMDKHNPHAAAALRKLGQALNKFTPQISQHLLASANVMDDAAQRHDPVYLDVLETLTRAWSDGRLVHLWHKHEESGKVSEYDFAPYFIEPYAVGQTTHVIGLRRPPGKIRTFKVERIQRAELLAETYTIPPDFNPQAILADAWGIWYTEAEPVEVVLRFHPRVAGRVKESRWHRSEDVVDQPDGYLLWRARIAEPQEMLPWIRGWGADCEVMGPEGLREKLKQESQKLAVLYQATVSTLPLYLIPYAKTNRETDQIHSLLYHLIDVGQVALVMWQEVLTESFRLRLAGMLNLTVDQTGQFIAFLAALHDLGKAFPGYQKKYGPIWLQEELKKVGLGLGGWGKAYEEKFPHGTVSTWALQKLLPESIGLDDSFAYQIAVAIGGHHGNWPPPTATDRLEAHGLLWDDLRRDLVYQVQTVFQPPFVVTPPANKRELNTFLTILSGLVSVADWLGSRNKECFGFVNDPMPTRQYAAKSAQKARESLLDLGWLGWQPNNQATSFAEAFAYLDFTESRGVQTQVIAAAHDLTPPALLILEAPTGIGKTETAVYLADAWLQQYAGRGLYVAMPTQATSNQMYERIGDFLNHRYPNQPVNFHLVHGQAAWLDDLKKTVELQHIGDDDAAGVLAESWFTPRKRTLLAPFGVGTVDQTLLSILQTRHFFVRLFGLSHKVIIFDEVHAYDTFMSTLFHRLLQWLNAIGTSVIILSATLPAETRRKLVEAYAGKELGEMDVAYPSLTLAVPNSEPVVIELPKPADITIQLKWDIGREPADILAYLQQKLVKGGCAAVICNTVRRAQDIYRVLEEARENHTLDIPEDDLILFHARFPPVWRQNIEQKVLKKFGKPDKNGHSPDRPHRAIVVATQVIEQSLDLDFDLMLTDLAPIDLLIQRAGRLHRHQRDETERHGHTRQLVIIPPELNDNNIPQFKRNRDVYEPYILLRSYLAVSDRSEIALPGDITRLIETVYGNLLDEAILTPAWQETLQEARREMEEHRHEAETNAKKQLVMAPDNRRLLSQCMLDLDEESPEVHETFRAQTRDIDPGISLICLHRDGEQLFIQIKEGRLPINLEGNVYPELIKYLQQNMITVQNKAVVHHFIPQYPPANWQKEAALRHCRLVIFENECYHDVPRYTLRLTRKFGLEIIKKEDA